MPRNILLAGITMFLLAGMAAAADHEQANSSPKDDRSSQNPPNVFFHQVQPGTPPATIVQEDESKAQRMMKAIERKDRDPQTLRGELMPIQTQQLMQNMMTLRKAGEYWLGIVCSPATPVLRVHLNLPEDQGLVVESVVPESPAAKAGIEVHDIVIQAGDKSVGSVDELAAAVEVAKDTPLNFEIIHAGKMKALDVTPEKSPPNMTRLTTGGPNEWKEIEQWMQKMHGGSGTPSMPNMHFQIIQPGAILPQGAPIEPELPNNMSIVITHNGGEPAQIMVKWNDKEWNVSEKELDKLPPDVRPHVELTLGQSAIAFATPRATFSATTSDKLIPAPPPGMFGSPGVQMNVQSLQNLERQLDELNRKVDQLKKEIENLRPQPLPPTETKPEK